MLLHTGIHVVVAYGSSLDHLFNGIMQQASKFQGNGNGNGNGNSGGSNGNGNGESVGL